MAKRSLKGALVLAGLALAGNAYTEGAQEIPQEDSKKTFLNASVRPGYEGMIFSYEAIGDRLYVRRTDEPQTGFIPIWGYDRNGDGLIDEKDGDPRLMGPEFDRTVNEIYGNWLKAKQLQTKLSQSGLSADDYNTLKTQYDLTQTELTILRKKLSQLETEVGLPVSESQSIFPEFSVGLDTRKIVESAKLQGYQSPAMSEEEAKRIENEYQKEMLKRKRHGLRRDFSWESRLSVLERLKLANYLKEIQGEGKRIPAPEGTQYQPTPKTRTPRTKKNIPFSLVAGGRIIVPTYTLQNEEEVRKFALANGLYGGELGFKLGKYFGLTGNISAGLDRRVLDVKELFDEEMFSGIYGINKGDLTNFLSLGVSAEGYIPFSDFFSWLISLGINTQSSIYRVEKSIEGPEGPIGVPEFDSPKDKKLISVSTAMGPEIKLSDIVRLSILGGAQVPIKQDDNPWGIDGNKITPSLALRLAFLLNGGN